ncbi:MAG: lysoplasmalogenase [Niastella sp.]|nr:lysoplasmalogenase [Niastella sp.]
MNKSNGFNIILLFWIVATVQLVSILLNFKAGIQFSKPLLLPILLLPVIINPSVHATRKKIIILALLFSWVGDIFLMFPANGYFIPGLVSFLLAHIFYIIYFFCIKPKSTPLPKQSPVIITAILAYAAILLFILFPHLGVLKIPVLLYTLVICSMLLAAIYFSAFTRQGAGRLFIMGALFFVCSDSLLAINKFYQPFTGAAFTIMLTYCIAQFLIVKAYMVNDIRSKLIT